MRKKLALLAADSANVTKILAGVLLEFENDFRGKQTIAKGKQTAQQYPDVNQALSHIVLAR